MPFQASEIHSFSLLSGIPLSINKYTTVCLSILILMVKGLFPIWGNYFQKSTMNILVRNFYKIVYMSLRVMIPFKIHCWAASHQQRVRVFIVLIPHQYLILSAFLIFAIPNGCEIISHDFTCISLMYHFTYLLDICILLLICDLA